MPHLVLEYSINLKDFSPQLALARLNSALVDSGQFEGPDIKSRAFQLDCFQIGNGSLESAGFAHVTLRLLSGRTPAVKKELSNALLDALTSACTPSVLGIEGLQLSIDVCDLEREFYSKRAT